MLLTSTAGNFQHLVLSFMDCRPNLVRVATDISTRSDVHHFSNAILSGQLATTGPENILLSYVSSCAWLSHLYHYGPKLDRYRIVVGPVYPARTDCPTRFRVHAEPKWIHPRDPTRLRYVISDVGVLACAMYNLRKQGYLYPDTRYRTRYCTW